jgi:hypothetical protein
VKLSCGPSEKAKREAKLEWHRWFAWRPIRVAENDCRWLEYVERKGKYFDCGLDWFWEWSYRAL